MFIRKDDFDKASNIAKSFNNPHINVETLLFVLMDRKDFVDYLYTQDENLSISQVKTELKTMLEKNRATAPVASPVPSYDLEMAIKAATATSLLINFKDLAYIEFVQYLVATDHPVMVNVFKTLNNKVHRDPILESILPQIEYDVGSIFGGSNKKMSNKQQEFLKYTTHLNAEIVNSPQTFSMAIARDAELTEMERVLLRKSKNSVILTGEPGVGKTNMVDSFVYKVVTKQVHSDLHNLQIYMLNIHDLLADIKFHGVLEARLANIIAVLEEDRNKILFIDEIHMLQNAGGNNGNLDIMNFLKAPMSKNKVRIIGATTNPEYRKYVEKNAAFTRRFCRIDLNEPNVSSTIEILNRTKHSYEEFYNIPISDEIVSAVVNMTDTYIKNRYNPDKSFDILDSMLARKRLVNENSLSLSNVYNEISIECHIPSDEMSKDKSEQLESLKEELNKRIIGQGHIFNELIDTLYITSAGLREVEKPMGSFLFQGSTASGKTQSSKIIAEKLGIPLLRYDMSAYQEKHTIATLIGSPPSYIGYSDGAAGSGKLINDIEKNPHCVLLLDEIEKAHPDVMNLLLQIMDYGKLTSSAGKDVYFNKVILIMTSNLGSRMAEKNSIGFGSMDRAQESTIDENIQSFLAPEFRSRLDGILKFKTMVLSDIELIAKQHVDDFIGSLSKFNITMNYDMDVIKHIAQKAIDSKLNARYVHTYISKTIKTKLAKILLQNSGKFDTPVSKKIILQDNAILVE